MRSLKLCFRPGAIAPGVFREKMAVCAPRRTHSCSTIPPQCAGMGPLGATCELKSVIGLTTAQTYEAWARTKGAEVLTDELPASAKFGSSHGE